MSIEYSNGVKLKLKHSIVVMVMVMNPEQLVVIDLNQLVEMDAEPNEDSS